ncbi:MAG: hypothetical protein ABSF76_11160 [Opitutaceae bacterium]|jgi:hypothetical protein
MKTYPIQLLQLGPQCAAWLVPVFVLACLLAALPSFASERWATLEAIHQLENPSDSERPGSFGELGPYQFREQTWKMHTTAPFSRALDRRSSDAVAVKHYDWIKAELERRGIAATPYRVALAWNGGIRAVVVEHPPAGAVDYALRAANLASEFERSEVAEDR